jgi:hypothetical protein
MIDIKWYNDQTAKIAYDQMRSKLDPLVVEMFPEYELSHFGINRNNDTEEVIIKLHLNKLGTVKVVGTEPWNDYTRLK